MYLTGSTVSVTHIDTGFAIRALIILLYIYIFTRGHWGIVDKKLMFLCCLYRHQVGPVVYSRTHILSIVMAHLINCVITVKCITLIVVFPSFVTVRVCNRKTDMTM